MAGRTVWLEHSKGEGTKKRLQGQPGGQCQIQGGLGEGGHMKGFGFISKDDIKVNAVSDSFLLGDTAFMLCQGLSVSSLDIEGVGTMEYGILPWLSPSGESNMIVSNVSRYYGLNKNLGEKGQEKRLENALRIMEFMSTEEGMQLLTTDTNSISPLNTLEITEGEMYYEIKDTIVGGNSIPLLYTGWDDIIIPFANELYSLMKDEQTVEECAKAMDDIRDKWLQKGPTNLGYVEETISKEDTAYLVGKIFVEMKNADAALISLGDFHGLGKENKFGVQCGIYAGDFHLDRMRTIVPAGTLGTITMRGEDILAKKEQGLYLDDPVTEDSIPFSYVLVTNKDMTLEPDKEYTVVITSDELPVELRETMIESWPAGDSQIIMEEYFKGYKKAITKDSIYQW